RGDHGHARARAEDSEIVDRLVRLSRFPGQDAAVPATEFDVEMRLGDHHTNLIERATGDERGESADPGYEPDRRHARRNAEQVLLGNAHLEEALRNRGLKNVGPG